MRILIAFLFTSWLIFQPSKEYILSPGIGITNIIVGKTTLEEAIACIGPYESHETKEVKCCGFYLNEYSYGKSSLTLVTNKYKDKTPHQIDTIAALIVRSPAHARTDEGVALGDNAEKIELIYGKPDVKSKEKKTTYYHYRKKGVSFTSDNLTEKIIAIEVYKPIVSVH